MRRLIVILAGLLASSLASVAAGTAAPTRPFPTIKVKTGSTSAIDGRELLRKDGKGITLTSSTVVASQMLAFKLVIPVPKKAPLNPAAARVAIAMHGSRMLTLKATVWLPKSKIWQTLPTSDLPTDKGSIVTFNLPLAKQSLAGDHVELSVRVEDHSPGSDELSVFVDAAMLQISRAKAIVKNEHQEANRLSNGNFPTVRVHSFAGSSSSSHEAKKAQLLKGFEKPPPKPKEKPKPKKKKKKKK